MALPLRCSSGSAAPGAVGTAVKGLLITAERIRRNVLLIVMVGNVASFVFTGGRLPRHHGTRPVVTGKPRSSCCCCASFRGGADVHGGIIAASSF